MLNFIKKFFRCEEGSLIPLIALSVFAVTGLVGVAVDSGRAYLVQSRMLTALDAAGLAAGTSVSTLNVQAEAEKYMRANYPAGYASSANPVVVAAVSPDKTVINLTATTTMPTVFMSLFGQDQMTVQVQSQVTRTSTGMELALVLDTTGSMADSVGAGGSKLDGAKAASHDLLDILYGDRETVNNLWVSLVPFAQAVNVGSSRTNWLDPNQYNNLDWGSTSWAGCVEARETNGDDISDNTPAQQPFKAYYWPDDSNNDWVRVTAQPVYQQVCTPKYCTTGKGKNKVTVQCGQTCVNQVVGYQNVTSYVINGTTGPNKYCSAKLTPMTASKSTVDAAIDQLSANGNTHISLGLAWAYRLLSPNWQNVWGGEMNTNHLPLAYNSPRMNKVVVLMTDGDNTISNGSKGAYGYLSEGRLGTTNSSTAVTSLNTRMTNVCNAMKSHNIIIYTVAFGDAISASSQNLLRNCATQPDYYFYSPTNADLQKSFKLIGDSLANLRVSK